MITETSSDFYHVSDHKSTYDRINVGLLFGRTNPRVSVVIPTLNEARNLPFVLPRIPQWVYEVILVDGRSTDDTVQVARELIPNIKIVYQTGRGKGDALRAGFDAATGDIVVMLDADASTDPAEIPAFVGSLLSGADFAKGSRFLQGGGTEDMELLRRLGNWGFVTLVRMLFGGSYTDLCYGYNAFWKDVLSYLDLDSTGFEIETLMNLRALAGGLKVVEVCSFEASRKFGFSNLRTFRDGWRVLKTIFKEYFHQRRAKYIASSKTTSRGNESLGPAVQTLLNEALQFVLFDSNTVSPEASHRALTAVRDSFASLVNMNQGHGAIPVSTPPTPDVQFYLTLSYDALASGSVETPATPSK